MGSWAKKLRHRVDVFRGKASATSANEGPVSKCVDHWLDACANV